MIILAFILMFVTVGSQYYRLTKANEALTQAEEANDLSGIKKHKQEKVIFTVSTIIMFTASIIMVIYAFVRLS